MSTREQLVCYHCHSIFDIEYAYFTKNTDSPLAFCSLACMSSSCQPGKEKEIVNMSGEYTIRELRRRDLNSFLTRIAAMNKVFTIPCNIKLTNLGKSRVKQFYSVLEDELIEGLKASENWDNDSKEAEETFLVDIADWLADIVVYCFSEANRWGIPLTEVLHRVMDSQESKLDENGRPILCETTGKFLKGPNYKPPEESIRSLLFGNEQENGPTVTCPTGVTVKWCKRLGVDGMVVSVLEGYCCKCSLKLNDELMKKLQSGTQPKFSCVECGNLIG